MKNDLITLPNPHLRERSKKVGFVGEDIKKLIAKMESATLDWESSREHEVGVALAAVQIDQRYRVVVIRNNFDDKSDKGFKVLINPEITKYEGELLDDYEGCLSVRNVYGKVPRYSRVRMKALDINGKEFRVTAEGFLARVLQHEIDHTNGIVFVDHIKDQKDAFFILNDEGKLEALNYNKEIKDNVELWGKN